MSTEVKEHILIVASSSPNKNKRIKKQQKNKKSKKKASKKKDTSSSSSIATSTINKSLLLIVLVLVAIRLSWGLIETTVNKQVDGMSIKASHLILNKILNNSNHLQTFESFINTSKLFMKENNIIINNNNNNNNNDKNNNDEIIDPPNANPNPAIDCCKRRPYCLDKCWFGKNNYATLSTIAYSRNELTQSCCNTKDGGVPLDMTLKQRVFLKIPNGFFIESGGQDGVFQSNTLVAEKIFGWHGLLIEPSKQLIDTCKSIREPKSKCIHGALAEPGAPKYVIGPTGSPTGKTKRTNSGSINDNMVQTFTISELLKMYKVTKVDFWSLDIEDHEYNALQGLDFSIHRPTYILIEVWKDNPKIFRKMESEGYVLQEGIHGRKDVSI